MPEIKTFMTYFARLQRNGFFVSAAYAKLVRSTIPDVNHVSTLLAEKLGGRSYQIQAPLFADDA